jgi:glycosyltransferase involved in cell wall biosynthesis
MSSSHDSFSFDLSVIIPTFNRKDVLLMCLTHLKHQAYPMDRFEVVVAIDGSTDGTADTLRSMNFPFRMNIAEQINSGPAAARNLGAGLATGKYLLFLDDDILATPELIAEHLSMHNQYPGSVVVGPTPTPVASGATALSDWQRDSYQTDIDRLNEWGFDAIDHYFCLGANGSLSREMFQRSGGFDASLHSEGDETELGLRLLDLGAKFRWNPNAVGNQLWVKDVDALCITDRKRRVINEVELLKRDSRFRVLSRFTDLFAGPWHKVRVRRILARFPRAIKNCSLFLYRLVRHLPNGLRFRLEGRLLKILWVTTHWETYRKHFGDPLKLAPSFNLKLPILMYHLVRDDLKPDEVVISTKKFAEQMSFLNKNGFTTITLSDWRDWVLFGKPLPPKPVILTFDDGFKDLYENAWRILKKYNFRFTAFVVTSRIGMRNQWEGIQEGKLPLISLQELQEMSADGAFFEAHSRTHPFLRKLSVSELHEEIRECKTDLKSLVGYDPQFFAYPYGDFRARERKCVAENDYLGACTTIQGMNTIRTDLYRLRRINISGKDSMLDFRLKLRFGGGFLNWTNLKQSAALILLEQFGLSKPGSPLKNLL